jgi:hypothetical protein
MSRQINSPTSGCSRPATISTPDSEGTQIFKYSNIQILRSPAATCIVLASLRPRLRSSANDNSRRHFRIRKRLIIAQLFECVPARIQSGEQLLLPPSWPLPRSTLVYVVIRRTEPLCSDTCARVAALGQPRSYCWCFMLVREASAGDLSQWTGRGEC